ncbi:Lar family restriction alleviation protein [Pseudomonas aeruginosa]|uniref:Lar family restriction alleviation protein n=1 Tax=Pseudomonas aeruginosa TaxID=287 RepID=UPI0021E94260|nr:Lar family restriction alleviation protein [Pseudomonas aeruginosa]MCV4004481.1 Lar family restriction alleviation protein [Pseudomonas aeruginosa]
MAEELKPCPFCGETPGADSYAHADGGCKYGAISCSCGVIGPDVRTGYKTWPEWRDSAVTAWNERAVPAGHVVVSEDLLRRIERECRRESDWNCENVPAGTKAATTRAKKMLEIANDLRDLLGEQEGGRQ